MDMEHLSNWHVKAIIVIRPEKYTLPNNMFFTLSGMAVAADEQRY